MEEKRPTIGVIGHVDHERVTLSAAATVVAKLHDMDAEVIDYNDDEQMSKSLRDISIPTYEVKDYSCIPKNLMYKAPETRSERRKRERNGQKAKFRKA